MNNGGSFHSKLLNYQRVTISTGPCSMSQTASLFTRPAILQNSSGCEIPSGFQKGLPTCIAMVTVSHGPFVDGLPN